MKKLILPLLFSLALCLTAEASPYAKIFGGGNFLQNHTLSGNKLRYQAGYLLSGSLGYTFCPGLSLEAEYAYRRNTLSKIHFVSQGSSHNGHLQTSSYMANLLWDLPLSCEAYCLRPYIGAGLGYDLHQLHASNSRVVFHQKCRHFSWQAMAGLAYSLFCNLDLTLEYKFHQGNTRFNNHAIGVGLQYTFDSSL